MIDALFISQQYLRERSIINDNTDWELLQPTVIGVQDIYLEQILGTIFYEDLKNKIDTNTLSTDETNLIKNYIQPVLLWYVQMESMPIFKYRFMNKGIMVNQSDNSQPISDQELDKQMDRLRIKAEVYAQRLTRYLVYNANTFTKYKEYQLEGKFPISNNFTTGIDLGDFAPIRYTNDTGDICRYE